MRIGVLFEVSTRDNSKGGQIGYTLIGTQILGFKWFQGCSKCGNKWMRGEKKHSSIGIIHAFECMECHTINVFVSQR